MPPPQRGTINLGDLNAQPLQATGLEAFANALGHIANVMYQQPEENRLSHVREVQMAYALGQQHPTAQGPLSLPGLDEEEEEWEEEEEEEDATGDLEP